MRPTVAYVDLDKLVHNYNAIKRHVGKAMLMAMVKADAYGMGFCLFRLRLPARVRIILEWRP